MCEGSASIAVDRDRVEGVCDEREVLPVGLLTRPRLDRGRSCERVTVLIGIVGVGTMVEVVSRRVLSTLFIMCILWFIQ